MILGNPWALYGMIVIVGCLIILFRGMFLLLARVNQVSVPMHRSLVLHNFSSVAIGTRVCLVGCSLIVLWGAALRFQYESLDKKPLSEQGRDVLIALDISRSMLAQDYEPSRLNFAKNKIKKLLTTLTSERVGLIIFSGSAMVQCPLTRDLEVFELFLNALDAESLSQGTTDVGSAIQAAFSIFEQHPVRKNKLLVIFTDGEDFSSDLAAVQKKAADVGVQICAMGVGTSEGAPVPCFDQQGVLQGHMRDEKQNIVMSRLNEPLLKSLVGSLSGLYVRSDGASDDDIERLQGWLEKFEKEQFAVTNHSSREETFMYFSGGGLLLLLISLLL